MILFSGDTHGDHQHLAEVAAELRPEAMIHVGDLDLEEPLAKAFKPVMDSCELYFIAGNHDFDQESHYANLFDGQSDRDLHTRVVEVGGLRIAGLAGNFQARIWYPPQTPRFSRRKAYLYTCGKGNRWRGGLPRKVRGAIWWEDYEKLADMRADVLVTHEAPCCHKYGFEALSELGEMMGVKTIVHGHQHEQYSTVLTNGIIVHGIGLCGISDQDGNIVRKGKLDDTRRDRWQETAT